MPKAGSIVRPPSRMSMNQRVSLYCCESALSPVSTVSSARLPVTGDLASRTRRTIASLTCVVRASWGRWAAEKGLAPGTRWVVSIGSTRPGDSSSTIWKSDSWRKLSSEPSRGGRKPGPAPTTTWGSPGAYSRRLSPSRSWIVRSTVDGGAPNAWGAASATAAMPRTRTLLLPPILPVVDDRTAARAGCPRPACVLPLHRRRLRIAGPRHAELLEQVQPHLAAGGERRDRVEETVDRHLAHHGRGGRLEELGHLGSREGGA